MLLICPVRPGEYNEELRYALRSWQTNLIFPEGLTLMTVGFKPSWLAPDWHVDGNHYKSMPLAVFDNVLLGAKKAIELEYSQCIYMNDDFFCLDPIGGVVPVRRDCTLAEHIAKFPRNGGLWWPRSLRLTADWLAEAGFPQPESYEVHRPLPATPEGMFRALSRWVRESGWEQGDIPDTVPQWRTLYGVLNGIEAHPVRDVKISLNGRGITSPWLSTTDENWRMFAQMMKRRFQKPSKWEVTPE
jgi:hypothetical protein